MVMAGSVLLTVPSVVLHGIAERSPTEGPTSGADEGWTMVDIRIRAPERRLGMASTDTRVAVDHLYSANEVNHALAG